MSVIVKNMEMPKRCFECPCLGEMFGYFVCLITTKDLRAEHGINISRPDWCPLVELPPHGRLKDESDIISLIEVMFCRDKDGMEHAIQCVKDAPTVIEAEGIET